MIRAELFRTAVAVLGAAAILAMHATAARAELHFPQASADLGEVRSGVPLQHRFTLVNRGAGPIEIVEVRASCGCLKPRLERRTYQPGETGTLLLEVNTLGEAEGRNRWQCLVVAQSGGRRFETALQITCQVVVEVSVRPAVLTLFTDGAVGHEVLLTDRRPKPLTVVGLRGSSSWIRAQLADQGRTGSGPWTGRVRLEVAAECPEGRHDEVLHILTDDPQYRELKVPITVVKRSRRRVTALPAEVSITAAAGLPIPARLVRLRDGQGQPVMVERVTADNPAIQCQWAAGPDIQATLKIQVDRARLAGDRLESAVHVHLSQPPGEQLTIPIMCLLRE